MSPHLQSDDKPGLRVLLMDDDPRVQVAMGAELAAAGWQATVLGPHQLATVAETVGAQFDVALIDVALPTVTAGLAVIAAVAVHIPVVAFSINGASRDSALAAGASAYLEKDGDTDQLLGTLHLLTAESTTPTRPSHRLDAHSPDPTRSSR